MNLFSITKYTEQSYIYIDYNLSILIKFLSCLMIALHHYSQYAIAELGSINPIYKLFSTQGGHLGVAIFFFLSGYGLTKSLNNNFTDFYLFIKKRLFKVYFPAVLVSLLWLPFIIINGYQDIWSLFRGCFWYFNDGVLWFVRTILILYIILYCLIYIQHYLRSNYSVISFLLISSFAVYGFIKFTGLNYGISVFFFFLGFAIVEYESCICKLIKNIKVLIPLILLDVILLYIFIYHFYNSLIIHFLINVFIFLVLIYTISYFCIKMNKVAPKWMGPLAYDVYLTHNKAKTILISIFPEVPFILFFTLAFTFSIVFYYIRKLVRI